MRDNEQIRITDGCNRTVDILKCKNDGYVAILYEASTDEEQSVTFDTQKDAQMFGEKWVWRR